MSLKSDLEDIKHNLKMINLWLNKDRYHMTIKSGTKVELTSTPRRFGKCDECGKVMYVGDLGIHTEWAEYFCSDKCWEKRYADIKKENGQDFRVKYQKGVLK